MVSGLRVAQPLSGFTMCSPARAPRITRVPPVCAGGRAHEGGQGVF